MWQVFRKSRKNECSRTRDRLSGYMDGRLSPEQVARVEEHLSTCQGCREELESLRATVALLRRLPEVTPSRRFAVAPVKPLPGRRALPALRFATAVAVLLLVLAFAADRTELFEGGMLSNPQFGPSTSDYGANRASEGVESYWVVAGVENTFDAQDNTTVELVVPDGSDNVYVAVDSLVTAGVIYGATESVPGEVPQLVLTEGGSETGTGGELKEYTVVSASDAEQSPFATNDTEGSKSAFNAIIEEQKELNGVFLNMVPASSDNSVLYSFNLGEAKKEVIAVKETDWLRPLEYSLIGLVAVLGSTAAALWLRQRRARAAAASYNRK